MRLRTVLACSVFALITADAQNAPVVSPRGVINAFTQQPAPTRVAPGGIIWISGISLGPPEGVKASGTPWPTQLGEPPIQVMINGRAAPIASATPARIVAQVPWETTPGLAQVVVRRGQAQTRPARFFVDPVRPSIRAENDQGYGVAGATTDGRTITLSAFGLGPAEPQIASGSAAGDNDIHPQLPARVFVGGVPALASIKMSKSRVGEYDVNIELPPKTLPGDVISVEAGGQAANRTTYRQSSVPEVQFLRLPDGAPELRGFNGSDLKGDYIVASGASSSDGCWPSVVFDFSANRAAIAEGCLTGASRNLPTPFVPVNEGDVLGALVGPPEGEPPSRVSSKLAVFKPGSTSVVTVDLPSSAIGLGSAPGGNILALLAGDPPRVVSVNPQSLEITDMEGVVGLPGGGGGGGQFLLNLEIDLGDGIKHVLSAPFGAGPGTIGLVVGDDESKPSKAKVALLNQRLEVQATRDFPDGWIPLVAPPPANLPGQGPGPVMPGGPGPGGPGGAVILAARFRVIVLFDAPTRTLFVVSRKTDDSAHGLSAFVPDEAAKAIPLPDGSFVAACSPLIPIFNLELARRVGIPITNVAERDVRNPCPGLGFALLDLTTQAVSTVNLPGSGRLSVNSVQDLNDYVYGSNTDPAQQGRADTLFVFDGVTASAFRLDLPPEVSTFAQLMPVPQMGALVGLAANRVAGDAGIIQFDLEQGKARLLPTPEGFAAVQIVAVFPTTRKIVARGMRAGNTGAQYLIYDMTTGDLAMPPNPDGVAWVAQVPLQGPPQPGQMPVQPLQRPNSKANAIAAVTYGEDRRQNGVILIRVP